MANWKDYLKVMDKKGRAAAWEFAKANFKVGSVDYESAKRFHSPSASDKRESLARQTAINSVSKREIRANCRFEGFFK